MEFPVYLAKSLIGYVGINLGRSDIAVTQHHLDGAKIGAVLEEVGGEAMSQ